MRHHYYGVLVTQMLGVTLCRYLKTKGGTVSKLLRVNEE